MLKRGYNYSEVVVEEGRHIKFAKRELGAVNIPICQKALVVEHFDKDLAFTTDISVEQHLEDYEILVQNKFVGLNHVDWKSKKYKFNIYSFPWVNGRESSGVVVKRGSRVDKDRFPLGAEVFLASTSYRILKTSTFQEYTVFDSRLVWRLPHSPTANGSLGVKKFDLDFAAGIGVALVTAGSALSHLVDFADLSTLSPRSNLIIWGGTSCVGIYLTQLARSSQRFNKILVVAAKRHENYLRELGATHVIDRHLTEGEILDQVNTICPQGINHGIDVVSKKTATHLMNILQQEGNGEKKLVCVVDAPELPTKTAFTNRTGKFIIEKVSIKKFHEDLEYGTTFVDYTSKLLESGHLKPVQSLKIFKALGKFGQSIRNGLLELEEKGPSAEKYVACLET
ncbi:hypothetical protein ZYGR_0N07670 [Zygosaccharomyces rouxii]|uniref:ZYRO0D17842p n=2 Tax=Zygosaccharomyces rouxii TaxID=4956 RepID=C5DWV3_ZYGRC|nr:uncharacterized protein ZYRO0D17842g [Zygosaccharomyces rouxii]KAH9201182.1 chaperonin 10-like protein [Zygosaccharomyces rouxii]GAV49360.1 hypothetical protein ZYGR_0N07670 [Zygosaccharomyces rouxii]CAR28272.1 ZYRO0D17842p [Zygosaccharomyces rouxii]